MPAGDRSTTAGAVVVSALAAIAVRLDETERGAARDAPDGVHQHRTAVRRLRGVLAVYRPLFDERALARLRVQFREWGSTLGTVRDLEVRADLAEAMLAESGLDDPTLRRRLVTDVREAHRLAQRRLPILLAGRQAEARRAALRAFLADPPVTDAAGLPAAETVRRLLLREVPRIERAATRADGLSSLHRVRKSARRLRYATEAVCTPPARLFTDDAERLMAAGEAVQDILGDHRDRIAVAEHIERAGIRAARAGEPSAPYPRLAALAASRAADRLTRLPAALDGLRAAAKAFGA